MRRKKLTVEQVKKLPHGTRIVARSIYSIQDHALINQERKMIGNYNGLGINNCIWNFKDLEQNAEEYNIKFYKYIDETIKNPTTVEEGYEFQIGDIVTGLHRGQWLKDYNAEILKIRENGRVDLKVIEEDRIYTDVWYLDELKLVKAKEKIQLPQTKTLPLEEDKSSENTFTKSMLKTGMWVETKAGQLGMVLLGTKNGDIISGTTWCYLNEYKEDLTRPNIDWGNIVKIYQPKTNESYYNFTSDRSIDSELIWTRPEIKNICDKNGIFEHTINGNAYWFRFEDNKILTYNLGAYIGVAKCHPDDEFDKDKGCRLALARAKEQEIKANLKQLHKDIEKLTE